MNKKPSNNTSIQPKITNFTINQNYMPKKSQNLQAPKISANKSSKTPSPRPKSRQKSPESIISIDSGRNTPDLEIYKKIKVDENKGQQVLKPREKTPNKAQQSDSKINSSSESHLTKNVLFYKDKIQSTPMGDYVSNILNKWYGNYALLERHHGWVQWVYPNHYASRFNNNSQALTQEEAKIFRNDIQIAKKLVKAYRMFLDFLGIDIQILENQNVTIKRSINYKDRYRETFITSWHNHMRVTRFLAHLNICGFRCVAIELVYFLEKEIFGEQGYQIISESARTTRNRENNKNAPLGAIAGARAFEEWVQYGKCKGQKQFDNLIQKCLSSIEVIEEKSIYFRNN